MKIDEIKKMNYKDLMKSLTEKREALRNFRFGIAGSKIRNMKEGGNLKRDIARHLTEITRRAKEEQHGS